MADNATSPMSTSDLRVNAANWTLAGDVGLLAHLQQFSDGILQQVDETEGALNNLLDRVEETSIKFHNISNQFLALQNSQFIENRVYEDDSPTDTVPVQPAVVEPDSQQKTLAIYKEAVSTGLKLLDSHYEQIEVPESSDSDDDSPESSKPFLLRPKPTYLAPLPLLIGSAEWWADDSVGLGEYQENEDSEPEVTPSDDGEEEEKGGTPPRHYIRGSTSSSASSEKTNEPPKPPEPKRSYHPPTTYNVPLDSGPPPDNNLFGPAKRDNFFGTDDLFGNYKTDNTRNSDLFGSSDSLATRPLGQDLFSPAGNLFDDPPPLSVAPAVAPRAATAENVTKRHQEPIKKTDLFSEHAEDDELFGEGTKRDLVQPKPVTSKVSNDFTKELAAKLGTAQNKKMGSVENEPKPQSSTNPMPQQPPTTNIIREEPPPVTTQPASNPYSSRPPRGLFDDSESESETFKPSLQPRIAPKIPSASTKPTNSPRAAQPSSTDPPRAAQPSSSKPPDINLFEDDSDSDDFQPSVKPRYLAPTNSAPNAPTKPTNPSGAPQPSSTKPPDINLFEDDSDSDDFKPSVKPRYLAPSNPVPNAPTKPTNPSGALQPSSAKPPDINLFEDDSDSDDFKPSVKPRYLAPSNPVPNASTKPPSNQPASLPSSKPPDVNLFADDEDSDDDLFGAANKWPASSRNTASGLFDTSPSDGLFGSSKGPSEDTSSNNSMSKDKNDVPVKKSNLFADDLFGDGDDDDLFAPKFAAKATKVPIPEESDSKPHDSSAEKLSASSPAPRGSLVEAPPLHSLSVPEDLFGGISNLEVSNNQTQSRLSDSNNDENLGDVTQAADSRDLGFIESSNISANASNAEAAQGSDSPANWFRPQLSSTSAAPNESSGYKTGTLGIIADVSEATEAPQEGKRISTIAEGSPFNSHAESTESGSNFSARVAEDIFAENQPSSISDRQVTTNPPRVQPRQVLLEDEEDDLFSNQTPSKIESVIKTESIATQLVLPKSIPPEDDLFGVSSRSTKKPSLFEDDEEDSSLFFDGKPRTVDNVSVSSGRSSIFDEVTPGKSTLPSVFEKASSGKASLFDSIDDDYDLFAPKEKVQPISTVAPKPNLPGIVEKDDEIFPREKPNIPEVAKVDKEKPPDLFQQNSLEHSITIQSQRAGLFEAQSEDFFLENSGEKKPNIDTQPDLPPLPPTPQGKEENNATILKAPESRNDESKTENIPKPEVAPSDIPSSKVAPGIIQGAEIRTEPRPTPPNTLAVENISAPRKPDEPDGEIFRPPVKKIGKLNIPVGLKINTAALLPGARLKKPEAPTENLPPVDLAQESGRTVETGTPLFEPNQASGPSTVKAAESPGDLLHSALRDRARIQVKRRPQTRKARQEALRTSGIDFGVPDDTLVSVVTPKDSLESSSTQFWSVENTPTSDFASPSNPLSPSTDGEDYFNVPALDSNEKDDVNLFDGKPDEGAAKPEVLFGKPPLISPAGVTAVNETQAKPLKSISSNSLFAEVIKEEHSESKSAVKKVHSKKVSLFDDEDDNLFDDVKSEEALVPSTKPVKSITAPEMTKTISTKASSSIFDDDDDNDEDLFKSPKQNVSVPAKSETLLQSTVKKPVTSLFEESDDEDIFSKTIVVPQQVSASKSAPEPAAPKTSSAVEENFVDPLGLLGN